MVVGRRRFTWRDDVRGIATVVALGSLALAALTIVMAAVFVLARPGLGG